MKCEGCVLDKKSGAEIEVANPQAEDDAVSGAG